MPFSATAFICLYNEADIIRDVIRHLGDQGVGVYVIDNWSTDGSGEMAREFWLEGYEKFPADGPSPYYSWGPLLRRVEALAHQSTSDWCLLHDADEIRRSPVPGESLLEGLERIDQQGYTAVNFQVYHFMPVDNNYAGNPEQHFRYYTLGHGDCQMRQVKAWKRSGYRVDLASTGGHFAKFPGVVVSPEFFILKHYPLRSAKQAERKVLVERMGRYDPQERAKKWHVQYNDLAISRQWLSRPEDLNEWQETVPPPVLPCPAALVRGD